MRPRRDTRSLLRRLLLATTALAACDGRGCQGGSSASPTATNPARPSAPLGFDRERCRRELAHAAVGSVPGSGAIDALIPTCGAGGTLAVWALRGHTLSRLVRSREAGGLFAPPEIVATGADRLGPIAPDAPDGPVVWRSPTSALDDAQEAADEWWAARIDPSAPPGARVRRGSVTMPHGLVGLGTLAPLGLVPGGVAVLGTLAQASSNPALARYEIRVPEQGIDAPRQAPATLAEGELRGYEPAHRVALAFAVEPGGEGELRAFALEGARWVARGRVPLARRQVLVVPRGVAASGPGGESYALFLVSSFDVGRRGDGACMVIDDALCVTPGPVELVRVGANGATSRTVAPRGLADALTLDASGRAVALYLTGGSDGGVERAERAARIDPAGGDVLADEIRPSDDVPPMDHPTLVRCEGEPWWVAEVLVSTADPVRGGRDASVGAARETAVMAAPMECFFTHDARASASPGAAR